MCEFVDETIVPLLESVLQHSDQQEYALANKLEDFKIMKHSIKSMKQKLDSIKVHYIQSTKIVLNLYQNISDQSLISESPGKQTFDTFMKSSEIIEHLLFSCNDLNDNCTKSLNDLLIIIKKIEQHTNIACDKSIHTLRNNIESLIQKLMSINLNSSNELTSDITDNKCQEINQVTENITTSTQEQMSYLKEIGMFKDQQEIEQQLEEKILNIRLVSSNEDIDLENESTVSSVTKEENLQQENINDINEKLTNLVQSLESVESENNQKRDELQRIEDIVNQRKVIITATKQENKKIIEISNIYEKNLNKLNSSTNSYQEKVEQHRQIDNNIKQLTQDIQDLKQIENNHISEEHATVEHNSKISEQLKLKETELEEVSQNNSIIERNNTNETLLAEKLRKITENELKITETELESAAILAKFRDDILNQLSTVKLNMTLPVDDHNITDIVVAKITSELTNVLKELDELAQVQGSDRKLFNVLKSECNIHEGKLATLQEEVKELRLKKEADKEHQRRKAILPPPMKPQRTSRDLDEGSECSVDCISIADFRKKIRLRNPGIKTKK